MCIYPQAILIQFFFLGAMPHLELAKVYALLETVSWVSLVAYGPLILQ